MVKGFLVVVFGLAVSACSTMGLSPREERSPKTIITDSAIKLGVIKKWRESEDKIRPHLEILVNNGRVLIVGRVPTPSHQIEAMRLAWSVDGVKEVLNEIEIGPDTGFIDSTKDTFITTQMKTGLTFKENVNSLNYDYKTYGGILYIIGTAQSEEELEQVLEVAQSLKGVKEIVNHIRIRNPDGTESSGSDVGQPQKFMPAAGELKQY